MPAREEIAWGLLDGKQALVTGEAAQAAYSAAKGGVLVNPHTLQARLQCERAGRRLARRCRSRIA